MGPKFPSVLEHPSRHRVAATSSVPPDTLTATGSTETPLVRSLPAEINGTPVTRYVVLDGPALAGATDRSFTWIPRTATADTHDIALHAHHTNAAPDTLVLQVTLTP